MNELCSSGPSSVSFFNQRIRNHLKTAESLRVSTDDDDDDDDDDMMIDDGGD